MKPWLVKSLCDGLYYSGLNGLINRMAGGVGAVLMLHQVRADKNAEFNANGMLSVSPEFFETLIKWLSESAYDVVAISEVPEKLSRVAKGENIRPFVVLTFDDGYLDNYEIAAPIMRKYNVPFTLYAATGLIEGTANLWWAALEWVLDKNEQIKCDFGHGTETILCASARDKCNTYERLMHHCQSVLTEKQQREFVTKLCDDHGVDVGAQSLAEMMSIEQLRKLSQDSLCTIGAHTVNHHALGRMEENDARKEIVAGSEVIAAVTGYKPAHLAYPYGNPIAAGKREFQLAKTLGFETAVTTRRGRLYGAHTDHLQALPRISINGYYQSLRFTKQWMTGVPAMLYNGGKRLNVD